MLVAIHQPHYLPWLRYFEKIARADAFIVLDTVQFNKNGWQNRNRIKTAQGPALLTVPVLARHRQRLDEVRINTAAPWRKKHWATLRQAYAKAPHFDSLAPFLEATYGRAWEWLNELNRHMLEGLLDALGIGTPLYYASALQPAGEATDRLVSLIRAVGGDTYYSGAFALEAYLDAKVLSEAGIGLVLQDWTAPTYAQGRGEFIADLSVVDLIMHHGPKAREIILAGGTARPYEATEGPPS